jgi:hypothetical protein
MGIGPVDAHLPMGCATSFISSLNGHESAFLALTFPEGRDLSDPLSERCERIEWASEATSAKYASRCASRGKNHISGHYSSTHPSDTEIATTREQTWVAFLLA